MSISGWAGLVCDVHAPAKNTESCAAVWYWTISLLKWHHKMKIPKQDKNKLISSLICASTSITFALECVKLGLDCSVSLLHRHLAWKKCPLSRPPQRTLGGWLTAERRWDHNVKCAALEWGSPSLSSSLFLPSLHLNHFSHLHYLHSLHSTLAFVEKWASLLCIVQTPMRLTRPLSFLDNITLKKN